MCSTGVSEDETLEFLEMTQGRNNYPHDSLPDSHRVSQVKSNM